MNDKQLKLIWQEQQSHWDYKKIVNSQNYPLCVAFNWRKLTSMMQEICQQISSDLERKVILIDIGCGGGGFYRNLENIVDTYIGLDPSKEMLSRVKPSQAQSFIQAVGENLPIKSKSVDLLVIKSVLDQCYSPDQLIAEAYRVLRDDGYILISLSNRDSYYKLFRQIYAFFQKNQTGHFFRESHQFYFNMPELLKLLKKHCFTPVKEKSLGYFVFPRVLQFLLPLRIYPYLTDCFDKIGTAILPTRGGAFIVLGRKLSKEFET